MFIIIVFQNDRWHVVLLSFLPDIVPIDIPLSLNSTDDPVSHSSPDDGILAVDENAMLLLNANLAILQAFFSSNDFAMLERELGEGSMVEFENEIFQL